MAAVWISFWWKVDELINWIEAQGQLFSLVCFSLYLFYTVYKIAEFGTGITTTIVVLAILELDGNHVSNTITLIEEIIATIIASIIWMIENFEYWRTV